ncbi:formate dehydrogenase subunit gamma [Rhodobacteraceae bacterium XHP0102]|nr:formate dehydrogenase subunit gamma [Rhodobacteraceae bacterium XHP0102]
MPRDHTDAHDPEITAIVMRHMGLEGPLLPILHALQGEFGYIPDAARPIICDALNITRAELHGVISFYHDFRSAPAAKHCLKICRAEACQAVGGKALSERVLAQLGLDWGARRADGALMVEPVYCLGLCACAPAAMLDGKLIARATVEKITARLTEAGL